MTEYRKGTVIGPYRLEQRISDVGGTALVYRASVAAPSWNGQNGKKVALKIARNNQQNAEIYETLLRKEIRLLSDLRHPGIIRAYPIPHGVNCLPIGRAVNLEGAPWYFVMELLEGGGLYGVIGNNSFPLQWRLEIIYQIAIVLDYIHLRTVAHRDLKPDNILFRARPTANSAPQPVLIDFGLAEKHAIQPEIKAASLSHASPERTWLLMNKQRSGFSTDHRADDVWALGVIAYELLTGRHPFEPLNVTPTALAQSILHKPVPPMGNDVPKAVQEMVSYRMLAKDPSNRWEIGKVLDWLDSHVDIVSPRV